MRYLRRLRTWGRVMVGGFVLAVALGLTPMATSPAQANGPTVCSAVPIGTSAYGYCSNPRPEVYFQLLAYCTGQWGTFPRYSIITSSYHTAWVACGSGEHVTAAFTHTHYVPPPNPTPPPTPTPTPTPPPPEPPWQPPCPGCHIP